MQLFLNAVHFVGQTLQRTRIRILLLHQLLNAGALFEQIAHQPRRLRVLHRLILGSLHALIGFARKQRLAQLAGLLKYVIHVVSPP